MEVIINKENYESEILKSDIPCIVDFWATWCGPCMMLGPIIEELSQELVGQCKVCKVNVDENMEIADKYNIFNIPTVLLIDKGQVINKSVGYVSKEELKNKFNIR